MTFICKTSRFLSDYASHLTDRASSLIRMHLDTVSHSVGKHEKLGNGGHFEGCSWSNACGCKNRSCRPETCECILFSSSLHHLNRLCSQLDTCVDVRTVIENLNYENPDRNQA